ncbi:uncharacterized protein LOC131530390 [Onychostoma macrolepis]|uniref:Ig-like domain-containing protein n=1 Tax=Onychostoma macrolepis TaxID=369639 RepID=A0A7J6BUS5_9TELE|nr:uncharacterized protein LOC131530390 [Onychostoma macrolepis]KAF4097422.1 hypothetical protein G5714_021430 [Onychostoma macrolepis]
MMGKRPENMIHPFVLFSLCLRLVGVFGVDTDEVKSVSVMKGESVSLNTDVTEAQKYLFIQWKFGSTRIAEVNRLTQTNSTYDADERFRDRLKLDQTGSLTITNTRTTDSGLYKLTVVSRETIYVSYNVTVYDEVKSVSVTEGDSVILHTDVTETQKYLFIQWKFGSTRIAEVNRLKQTNSTYDADGRFRDRLKLDQTGSLTITNTRTTDSGLYQLAVVNKETIYISYNVTVYAVTDEVKSVSGMEGDSVTLNTDVTETQKYLFIQWMFGSTRIAEVNRLTQTSSTYDADGRFRDRLKLDQTGSLIITNTRTTDSGLYKLAVVNRETSYMNYKVTVYETSSSSNLSSSCAVNSSTINRNEDANVTELYQPSSDHIHCCGFTEAVIRLALSALVGVAAIAVLVYDVRSTRSELNRTEYTKYLYQTHGIKSDIQYERSRRLSSRYIQM